MIFSSVMFLGRWTDKKWRAYWHNNILVSQEGQDWAQRRFCNITIILSTLRPSSMRREWRRVRKWHALSRQGDWLIMWQALRPSSIWQEWIRVKWCHAHIRQCIGSIFRCAVVLARNTIVVSVDIVATIFIVIIRYDIVSTVFVIIVIGGIMVEITVMLIIIVVGYPFPCYLAWLGS